MRLFYALAAVCLMAAPAAAETAKTEAHHVPGHEQHTYRFGATYEVSSANSASVCQAQCDGAAQCKSWSYLRPVRTAAAYCELKRGVGSAEANPTATSGVSVKGAQYADRARYTPVTTRTLRGGPAPTTRRMTTTRRPATAPTPSARPTTRPVTRRAPMPAVSQPTPRTRAPATTRTRTTIRPSTTTTTTTRTTTTQRTNVKPIPQTRTVITSAPTTQQHTVRTAPAPTYYPKQQEEISRIVTGPTEFYKQEDGKPRYSVQDPKNMIEDNEASAKRPSS